MGGRGVGMEVFGLMVVVVVLLFRGVLLVEGGRERECWRLDVDRRG